MFFLILFIIFVALCFIAICYVHRGVFSLSAIIFSCSLISACYETYGFEGIAIGYIPSMIIESLIQ